MALSSSSVTESARNTAMDMKGAAAPSLRSTIRGSDIMKNWPNAPQVQPCGHTAGRVQLRPSSPTA